MEEIQNNGQPEVVPEVDAEMNEPEVDAEAVGSDVDAEVIEPEVDAEVIEPEVDAEVIVPEEEPVEEQQDSEQEDAPDEDATEQDRSKIGEIWDMVKAFTIKRKRLVMYAAIGLVALLVVLFVIHRNRVGKNRYETLVQTITEMKRISEFCTANYIGEVMVQDEEKQFLNRKNIVLIVRGKIRMGYDLSKMETEVVNDSTINITLPQARILDIITNPSDVRTFSEKGHWTHERVTITKNAARAKLLELVMEENMLATAEENGKRQLAAIFSSFGFRHVNMVFVADSTVCEDSAMVGDSVSENATTIFSH
jgi:transcription antitermination factor NusG